MSFTNVIKQRTDDGSLYHCPCCHYKTLGERGGFELCPICFWEDDGQDDHDADIIRGGPNSNLSLSQARQNFVEFGAYTRSALQYVRAPKLDES